MSSSGKGQTIVEDCSDTDSLKASWQYAVDNMCGSRPKVIIEEFIQFDFEITLLTIHADQTTTFCDPIVHIQKDGDFKFSQQFETNNIWQLRPSNQLIMSYEIQSIIASAQVNAAKITSALGGDGLFGVGFFVKGSDVIFSELSQRPHDTGLVTLKSQNYSQFDLHARAMLNLPIPKVHTVKSTQVHTINADKQSNEFTINIDKVADNVDVHLYNPATAS